MKYIEPALARAAKWFERKLRDPQALASAKDRLRADPDGSGVATADAVIEAVFEDLAVKRSVYERVEPQLKAGALLATNTSSIPLETLAECLQDPAGWSGLHFFNPVAKLPLVEIVEALATWPRPPRTVSRSPARSASCPSPPQPPRISRSTDLALTSARRWRIRASRWAIDQAAVDFDADGPVEPPTRSASTSPATWRRSSHRCSNGPSHRKSRNSWRAAISASRRAGFLHLPRRPSRAAAANRRRRPLWSATARSRPAERGRHVPARRIVADADLVDAGVIFGTGFAPFRAALSTTPSFGRHGGHREAARGARRPLWPRFRPSPGWKLLRD